MFHLQRENSSILELAALCTRCLNDGLDVYSNLEADDLDMSRTSTVTSRADSLLTSLSRITALMAEFRPQIKDVNEDDLASLLEKEMQQTVELISRAEERFKVRGSRTSELMHLNQRVVNIYYSPFRISWKNQSPS